MKNLRHKKCIVTAGPTYEAIDPVRFIGNRSSGKMGIALAQVLKEKGAEVTLIIGPTSLDIPKNIDRIVPVESSDEMYNAVMNEFETMEIGIFAAAVADYKPLDISKEKIKKTGNELVLYLVKTKDILMEVGMKKRKDQIIVGFALETENAKENAKDKLIKKNLNLIVLNSLKNDGAGFQFDTNQISILDKENNVTDFELKSKIEVARDIIDYIERKLI